MEKRDRRIVCIGLGFLMEDIADNYINYLGDQLADNMIATTLDKDDIPRKSEKFPFRIQYGNNAAALKELEPTLILLSVPPKAARAVTESDLLPYYEDCRKAGRRLPMLVAFPPAPDGRYYMETLGEDIEVANALPNPVIKICGRRYEGEGVNFLTFPDKNSWTEEGMSEIREFFSPTGVPMVFTPSQTMTALGAGAVVNPLSMFAYTISDTWREEGVECSDGQIAEAMRACLEEKSGYVPHEDVPSAGFFCAEAADFITMTVCGFFSGLIRFLTDNGFSRELAEAYLYPFGDLYLHSYMRESRDVIELKRRGQATKGGVVELAVRLFEENLREQLEKAATSSIRGELPEDWDAFTEEFAYCSAAAVARHAAGLD